MLTHLAAEARRVRPHHLVDRIRGQHLVDTLGARSVDLPEQSATDFTTLAGRLEELRDARAGSRMRQVACLAALALDGQVHHAAALLPRVVGAQLAQLLAAQPAIQQCRQDRAIALPLKGVGRRRLPTVRYVIRSAQSRRRRG